MATAAERIVEFLAAQGIDRAFCVPGESYIALLDALHGSAIDLVTCRSEGGAGFMAGGLFNLFLQGQGMVAVTSDGPPMLLDCSQQPTFVDPQAAVCWSANLQPQIKNDFKMGSLIGRGSGESFQLGFHGPGFVVVQPSEGAPVVAAS